MKTKKLIENIYELQYKAFIQELKHESPDFYKNKIYYNKIDENNIYIISELIDNCNSKIIGIASLTPPKSDEYSFEKSNILIQNGETEYVIVYQECNKVIYDSWYKNIVLMIKILLI